MVAQQWRAQFEWYAHAQLARKAGISQGIIDAIHRGEKPASIDAQEEAIWQFAKELLRTQSVSEPTFAKAKQLFGQNGVVDLVGVMGYYGLVSMTLNTFQVPLPEGEKLPFKEEAESRFFAVATARSIRVSLSPRRLLSQKFDLLLDGAVAGAQCPQGHEVAES